MIFALPLLLIAGTPAAPPVPAAPFAPSAANANKAQQPAPSPPLRAAILASVQIISAERIRFAAVDANKRDTRRQYTSPGRTGGGIMIEFY